MIIGIVIGFFVGELVGVLIMAVISYCKDDTQEEQNIKDERNENIENKDFRESSC